MIWWQQHVPTTLSSKGTILEARRVVDGKLSDKEARVASRQDALNPNGSDDPNGSVDHSGSFDPDGSADSDGSVDPTASDPTGPSGGGAERSGPSHLLSADPTGVPSLGSADAFSRGASRTLAKLHWLYERARLVTGREAMRKRLLMLHRRHASAPVDSADAQASSARASS
ncbi:MAG: hypothetical protein SGPRY_005638 [Prymnesium sp.]